MSLTHTFHIFVIVSFHKSDTQYFLLSYLISEYNKNCQIHDYSGQGTEEISAQLVKEENQSTTIMRGLILL